jgi:hypothetical protein
MFSRRILLSMLGFGLTIGSAHATTTYSSAAAFAAALSGAGFTPTTITFTNDMCFLCASLTDSSVEFDSTQMNIGTPAGWPDGNVLERSAGNGSISITPASTFFAFGLNIVTVSGAGFPVDVLFNDGSAEDVSLTAASAGSAVFFGAISATPITNLQVSTTFNFLTFGVDDVTIGAGASTPDAPTMLLFGGGLIMLNLLYRRRRQRA